MDHQRVHDILSGRRRGLAAGLLRAALSVAAAPYAAAMRIRRWAYRMRLLPSSRASIPVICVGNITTGGTGKTPMAAWVVQQLQAAGIEPAVIARGYKSRAGLADEAEMLRRLCSVPVVVNPNRRRAARAAAEQGAGVCVMDDGFQHLALRRDLDIVLVDATNPFGYGRCLPAGLLREPLSALRQAHAVVVTRADSIGEQDMQRLRRRLSALAPQASLHAAVHRPHALLDQQGRQLPLEALAGQKVFAFCGIGNPQPFFSALEGLGAAIVGKETYDDHEGYPPATVEKLLCRARLTDCQAMVTTEKDYVKLPAELFSVPLWRLCVRMDLVEGKQELVALILGAASKARGE